MFLSLLPQDSGAPKHTAKKKKKRNESSQVNSSARGVLSAQEIESLTLDGICSLREGLST